MPLSSGSGLSHHGELFGRPTTLAWATDEGMVVAALLFAALGLAAYALAARAR